MIVAKGVMTFAGLQLSLRWSPRLNMFEEDLRAAPTCIQRGPITHLLAHDYSETMLRYNLLVCPFGAALLRLPSSPKEACQWCGLSSGARLERFCIMYTCNHDGNWMGAST